MSKFIKHSNNSNNNVAFRFERVSSIRFNVIQSSPRVYSPFLYPRRLIFKNYSLRSHLALSTTFFDLRISDVHNKNLVVSSHISRPLCIEPNKKYEKLGYISETVIHRMDFVFNYFASNKSFLTLLTYCLHKKIAVKNIGFHVVLNRVDFDGVSHDRIGILSGDLALLFTKFWSTYSQNNCFGFHAVAMNRTKLPEYTTVLGSFTHSQYHHLLPTSNFIVNFRGDKGLSRVVLNESEKLLHFERIYQQVNKEPFVLQVTLSILFPDFGNFMRDKGYINQDYTFDDVTNLLSGAVVNNNSIGDDFELQIGSLTTLMSGNPSQGYKSRLSKVADENSGHGLLQNIDTTSSTHYLSGDIQYNLLNNNLISEVDSIDSSVSAAKSKISDLNLGNKTLYQIGFQSFEGIMEDTPALTSVAIKNLEIDREIRDVRHQKLSYTSVDDKDQEVFNRTCDATIKELIASKQSLPVKMGPTKPFALRQTPSICFTEYDFVHSSSGPILSHYYDRYRRSDKDKSGIDSIIDSL